jgi:two-component system osmolarity sensor histidine kinase EnvZ
MTNLIGNARKYATHIWVEARRTEDTVRITVDDNGPGVPGDQFEDMFKPFVRGEPSRNPETGGVGLGLPIAQDIVTGHGGRIWLEKSAHGGLRVAIELPV